MSEEEKAAVEIVTLPTGGSIPGIPGAHGPGRYIIDWFERKLTPIEYIVEGMAARIEEVFHADHEAVETAAPVEQPSEPATSANPE